MRGDIKPFLGSQSPIDGYYCAIAMVLSLESPISYLEAQDVLIFLMLLQEFGLASSVVETLLGQGQQGQTLSSCGFASSWWSSELASHISFFRMMMMMIL
jgi:hypothetical protein